MIEWYRFINFNIPGNARMVLIVMAKPDFNS